MSITEIRQAVDSLSVAELSREIEKHFVQSEAILTEAKARGGLTAEQSTQYADVLNTVDSLEAVLSRKQSDEQNTARMRALIEKRRTPATPMQHGTPDREDRVVEQRSGNRKTIGQQFIESAEFRTMYPAGVPRSDIGMLPQVGVELKNYSQREHKTLLQGGDAASGGGFTINDRYPGVVDLRQHQLTVLDLITRLTTSSDTIDWVQQDTFTNAAATVAEATATSGTSGTKAESELAYSLQSSPVTTIAHWIPVTTRMLSDYPAIKGMIDNALMLGLDLALEAQILTGNNSAPNLNGILNNSSVQTQALGSDSVPDAMFKAMVKVQVTGLAVPNAFVFNPLDWQDIRLLRENASTGLLGQYLFGPPSVTGPATLWGRPVVESIGLTQNTGLVADFSALSMILWDREQAVVRTGYVDQMFIRNMVALLAEIRVAFTFMRPTAACKVSGI